MSDIILHNQNTENFTNIANIFIDEYMPKSQGEFVKIYLYLLRCFNTNTPVSIQSIADKFEIYEKDVERALIYWDKEGILALQRDNNEIITSLNILEVKQKKSNNINIVSRKSPKFIKTFNILKNNQTDNENIKTANTNNTDENEDEDKNINRHSYTPKDASEIIETKKLEIILEKLENQGKVISASDLSTICFITEDLGFPGDLLDYLVEYCNRCHITTLEYIEKVAILWHHNNIKTREDAEKFTSNSPYKKIKEALGIDKIVPAQFHLINTWNLDYNLSFDLILEACKRTVLQTNKPTFKYLEKIIEDWHQNNVQTIKDVEELDKKFNKKQKQKKNKSNNQKSQPVNKFHNFDQQDYDFEELNRIIIEQQQTE